VCSLIVFFCCLCLFVPSVLWYCWLGHLAWKTVSQITYIVLVETWNHAQSINQSINRSLCTSVRCRRSSSSISSSSSIDCAAGVCCSTFSARVFASAGPTVWDSLLVYLRRSTARPNVTWKRKLFDWSSRFADSAVGLLLRIALYKSTLVVTTQMFKTKTKTEILSSRTKTHKLRNQKHNSITDQFLKNHYSRSHENDLIITIKI